MNNESTPWVGDWKRSEDVANKLRDVQQRQFDYWQSVRELEALTGLPLQSTTNFADLGIRAIATTDYARKQWILTFETYSKRETP